MSFATRSRAGWRLFTAAHISQLLDANSPISEFSVVIDQLAQRWIIFKRLLGTKYKKRNLGCLPKFCI